MSAREAKDGMPFRLRPFAPEDRNWILSTWLRENLPDSRVPREVYFRAQEARIKAWLERPEREIVVACDADPRSDWHAFGWAAAERRGKLRILHFVFVKGPFRRQRIATALLDELGGKMAFVVHTHDGRSLKHLRLSSRFDPYAFEVAP